MAEAQLENLTAEQAKLLQKAAHAAAARRDFLAYTTYIDPMYQTPPHIVEMCQALQGLEEGVTKRLIITLPPRHGKQLAHDTPVLTPVGWKQHGNLQPGDFVFGRDGTPKLVEGESAETLTEYRVYFSDGGTIDCHGNHEWVVYDRRQTKERTLETKTLAATKLDVSVLGKRGHRYHIQVDPNTTVNFPAQNLPLDPYWLGVWLGDGKSSAPSICSSAKDIDVISRCAEIYPISSSWKHKDTGVLYFYFSDIIHHLRSVGVLDNKHIPDIYQYASVEQRLQLLAGLVDTDGHKDKSDRYRISTASVQLANDIAALVRSLGSYAYVMEQTDTRDRCIKSLGTVYQVGFNLTHKLPCTLTRKQNTRAYKPRRRAITNIERLTAEAQQPGKCIQVEGGVYLVGETLLPTHNSVTTTGTFPAWCLGRDPSRTVIITSYAATLAEKFSEQNRDTIMLNERWRDVFPGVSVNPNKKRKDNWCLMGRTESCKAAGVGGGISGFGAWLLLIDDPIKDAEQAASASYNQKVWEWFQTTSRTRLAPDGRIVVIMTRWAEGDLVDRIMESEEADDWEILHLPALSYGVNIEEHREPGMTDEDLQQVMEGIPKTAFPDPLHRKRGEALWPDRFDEEWLAVTKSVMGHHFTALYQGHPTEPAGHEFKREWFRLITPKLLTKLQAKPIRRARSWDIAWSSSSRADWTVGLKATLYEIPKTLRNELATRADLREFGLMVNLNLPPILLVVEDVQRWRSEWDETSAEMIKIAGDDTNRYKMLVEAVASQNVAFKSLAKELRLWKHKIIPVVPDKDKEARAKLALKLASNGCVFLLSPPDSSYPVWAKEFLKELGDFASGKTVKDDQVDALTQVVNYWAATIDKHLTDMPTQYLKTPFAEKRAAEQEPKPVRETIPEFQYMEDPFDRQVDGLGWRVIG